MITVDDRDRVRVATQAIGEVEIGWHGCVGGFTGRCSEEGFASSELAPAFDVIQVGACEPNPPTVRAAAIVDDRFVDPGSRPLSHHLGVGLATEPLAVGGELLRKRWFGVWRLQRWGCEQDHRPDTARMRLEVSGGEDRPHGVAQQDHPVEGKLLPQMFEIGDVFL